MKQRCQRYANANRDRWTYCTKKAEVQIKVTPAGVPGIQVRETQASERVWQRPKPAATGAFYDFKAALPTLDLHRSFQQMANPYNRLADEPSYWTVVSAT